MLQNQQANPGPAETRLSDEVKFQVVRYITFLIFIYYNLNYFRCLISF